jgi:hypothetical protein
VQYLPLREQKPDRPGVPAARGLPRDGAYISWREPEARRMIHAHSFPSSDSGYFMIESIHDPIEVIAVFTGGVMKPVRFRWKNKTVKIARVTGDWVRHEGQNKIHYFALLADNQDYYEVRYDTRDTTWQLTRVWMEG